MRKKDLEKFIIELKNKKFKGDLEMDKNKIASELVKIAKSIITRKEKIAAKGAREVSQELSNQLSNLFNLISNALWKINGAWQELKPTAEESPRLIKFMDDGIKILQEAKKRLS